jgi:hypothetical protein
MTRYVGVDVGPILKAVEGLQAMEQRRAEVVYDADAGEVVALVREPTQTGIGAGALARAMNDANEGSTP